MSTTTSALPRSPVRPPAAGDTRRADIQGLRAAAVIFVVLFHSGAGLSGGFIGVDVFFVVSGFVISGMLMRELDAHGRIRFGSFYLRRARRLFPALAVVSVVTLVAAALVLSPLSGAQEATGMAGVAASVFAANGYFLTGGYFNPVVEGNPFLHLWTLSVEEQFYVVFPLLLLVVWLLRRKFSERYALMTFVVVMGISFGAGVCFTFGWLPKVAALTAFLTDPQISANFAFFTPMTRGWEFLAGALLAFIVARHRISGGVATVSGAVGAVVLCTVAVRLTQADPFPGWLALTPVLGAVLLLIAGSGGTHGSLNVVPRLLSWRPMVRLGDLSYSWYLWHWPVIVLARAVFPDVPRVGLIAAVLSLAPAIASYRLVEQPLHRGHRMASARGSAVLIAGCLVVPLALGYGLTTAAREGWGQARIAGAQAAMRPQHLDFAAGCESRAPLGSTWRPSCTWTVPHARGTVLLIGDSNAGQFTEPLIAAARPNRLNVEVSGNGGCPFLVRPTYFDDTCKTYVQGSLATILSRRPAYDVIVISNAAVGYVNGTWATELAADAPASAGDLQQRAIAGWAGGLERTLRAVSARSPVILIGAIPQYAGFPACLAPTIMAAPAPGCGTLSAAAASRQRAGVVAADRKAMSTVPGRYLDTAGRLCSPTAGCSAFYDHKPAYRDAAHLSVAGSYLFQDDLRVALASLLKRRG